MVPLAAASNGSATNLGASSTANSTKPVRNLKTEINWSVNVDWQTKGCVTGTKDQGQYGVCWGFAATTALEAGYGVKTGSLPVLFQQDTVSCSRPEASCGAFRLDRVLDWMTHQNGGSICTAASYPYVSGFGTAPGRKQYTDPNFKCDRPNLGAYFYAGGYFADHTEFEAAVMKQPVTVAVRATTDYLQRYKSGVLMRMSKRAQLIKPTTLC